MGERKKERKKGMKEGMKERSDYIGTGREKETTRVKMG